MNGDLSNDLNVCQQPGKCNRTSPVKEHSTILVDGKVITLTVLPPADLYPPQKYWIPTRHNIVGQEVAFLPSLLGGNFLDPKNLPRGHDTTYVIPVDRPELEANERQTVQKLLGLEQKMAEQIDLLMEEHRDGETLEIDLLQKALEKLKHIEKHYETSLKEIYNQGDSIQRILRLYYQDPKDKTARHQIDGLSLNMSCPKSFNPCAHTGDCDFTTCTCHRFNRLCTRFCLCPSSCPTRHPGCRCAKLKKHNGNCLSSKCSCRMWGFECDFQICGHSACTNMEMTLTLLDNNNEDHDDNDDDNGGHNHYLVVQPSKVAGWGCFTKKYIPKGSFIMEYTGETISRVEAERRGFLYDLGNSNFLYQLDLYEFVDATFVGSLVRFCNHSRHNSNAHGKVRWVMGALRIGIFASRNIFAQEEILIDYGSHYVKEHFFEAPISSIKR